MQNEKLRHTNYQMDSKESNPDRKWKFKNFIPSIIYGLALIIQIILVFFFYNFYHLELLLWVGWLILILFLFIGALPRQAFTKYGEAPQGKSHIYTTKLVDKGIFAIIRHPYWLSWILLSIALTLMSQHLTMIILALIICPTVYFETYNLDKGTIEKFGSSYKLYMNKVPRMNLIYGIFKYMLNQRKKK